VKIQILPSAKQDLVDGFHFYEARAEGLGTYFLDSLYSDIDSLLVYGGIHPVWFGSYYRMLSKRFPFAVYYRVDGEVICVLAVLDCRSSPTFQRNRLR